MNKKILLAMVSMATLLSIGAGCAPKNKADNDTGDPSLTNRTFVDDQGNNGTAVESDSLEEGKDISVVIKTGISCIKTKIGVKDVVTADYENALDVYGKSGWRFQFVKCSGTPGSLIMKLGTKFMIDNRDDTGHQIAIGAQSYKLSAYDFAIISIKKAGSYNITCDGGGAARVEISK